MRKRAETSANPTERLVGEAIGRPRSNSLIAGERAQMSRKIADADRLIAQCEGRVNEALAQYQQSKDNLDAAARESIAAAAALSRAQRELETFLMTLLLNKKILRILCAHHHQTTVPTDAKWPVVIEVLTDLAAKYKEAAATYGERAACAGRDGLSEFMHNLLKEGDDLLGYAKILEQGDAQGRQVSGLSAEQQAVMRKQAKSNQTAVFSLPFPALSTVFPLVKNSPHHPLVRLFASRKVSPSSGMGLTRVNEAHEEVLNQAQYSPQFLIDLRHFVDICKVIAAIPVDYFDASEEGLPDHQLALCAWLRKHARLEAMRDEAQGKSDTLEDILQSRKSDVDNWRDELKKEREQWRQARDNKLKLQLETWMLSSSVDTAAQDSAPSSTETEKTTPRREQRHVAQSDVGRAKNFDLRQPPSSVADLFCWQRVKSEQAAEQNCFWLHAHTGPAVAQLLQSLRKAREAWQPSAVPKDAKPPGSFEEKLQHMAEYASEPARTAYALFWDQFAVRDSDPNGMHLFDNPEHSSVAKDAIELITTYKDHLIWLRHHHELHQKLRHFVAQELKDRTDINGLLQQMSDDIQQILEQEGEQLARLAQRVHVLFGEALQSYQRHLKSLGAEDELITWPGVQQAQPMIQQAYHDMVFLVRTAYFLQNLESSLIELAGQCGVSLSSCLQNQVLDVYNQWTCFYTDNQAQRENLERVAAWYKARYECRRQIMPELIRALQEIYHDGTYRHVHSVTNRDEDIHTELGSFIKQLNDYVMDKPGALANLHAFFTEPTMNFEVNFPKQPEFCRLLKRVAEGVKKVENQYGKYVPGAPWVFKPAPSSSGLKRR